METPRLMAISNRWINVEKKRKLTMMRSIRSHGEKKVMPRS
jgi:hypothetical protein